MPKYSFITCISDPQVYSECTLRSINDQRQDHDIEIIPIINNDNRYSASNALNIGIDTSRSDYLIFCHQDIRILDNWLYKLDRVIAEIGDGWGILGAAGISLKYGRQDVGKWGGALEEDTLAVGSVYDNDNGLLKEPYWNGGKSTQPVHCVDECLFIMRKATGIRFDSTFNGFHFYGVDACLQARAAGYLIYAADLPLVHYGKYSASFSSDQRYWHFYRLLHHKWSRRFPELLGTHMHWSKHEMTSYIPVTMEDDIGNSITIKAAGLVNARFDHEKIAQD
jgi:glycosyltransferase involved in cell wall biosynthesis